MNLINSIADRFEDKSAKSFNTVSNFDMDAEWISTGSPSLDLNLKTFGIPTGIVEVRGDSQSGKTTFSLHCMKSTINHYGDRAVVVILSSERRDNKSYAENMGLDTSKVLTIRVKTMEDVFNKIHQTIYKANESLQYNLREDVKKGYPKLKVESKEFAAKLEEKIEEYGRLRFLFVWDSLGNTVSRQELEKAKENAMKNETKMAALGSAARALSVGLRAAVGISDEENFTLLIINRPYDKVDGQPGKNSYGGKAIKLYPCMRIELARYSGVKVGEEELGQKTQISVIKSDFDRPKQKFYVEICYGYGIVLGEEDIKIGIKAGILEKFGRGGASFMNGKLKWGTRKELYDLYMEKNKLLKVLITKLTKESNKRVLKLREQENG